MGIFYAQKTGSDIAVAVATSDGKVIYDGDGGGGNGNGPPEMKWERVWIALAILGVLLGVGIWCSMNKIEPWNSILPGIFEIGIGGVFGILLGENVAQS